MCRGPNRPEHYIKVAGSYPVLNASEKIYFYVFTDLQALSLSDNHIKILAESFT